MYLIKSLSIHSFGVAITYENAHLTLYKLKNVAINHVS